MHWTRLQGSTLHRARLQEAIGGMIGGFYFCFTSIGRQYSAIQWAVNRFNQ